MTSYSNSAEGGTSGVTVTAGNSGGASGDAFDAITIGVSSTLTFDNTHAAHGSLAYEISGGTAVQTFAARSFAAPTASVALRMYAYLAAFPASGGQTLFGFYSGSTNRVRVSVNATGKILINSAAGGQVTSTTSLALNQWFRIDITATLSATVGASSVGIYKTSMDGTTPDETIGQTGVNYGGTADRTRFGVAVAPTGAIATFWMDDLAWNDTGAAIGPYTAAASVAPPAGIATGAATAPAVSAAVTLAPPAGAATADATSPGVTAAVSLAPPAGAAVAGATAPSVTAAVSVAPPAGVATGAATSPAVTTAVNVTPPAASATGSATSPAVSAAVTIAVPAAVATAAGTAPAITITYTASPPAGAATGDATSPTVTAAVTIYPPAAEAIAAATPPTITVVPPRDLTVIPGPTVTHYRNGASAGPTYSAGPTASRTSSGPPAGPGYQTGPTTTRYRTGATAT